MNRDVMTDVIIVMVIRMQNHKCKLQWSGECFSDFHSELPYQGARGFTSQ